MAEINVGRVRIGWKGEWDETTEYKALDAVTFEGSSYVATVDPPVGTAPTSADFWQLMAEKGADGPPGERGPQGPEGPAGTNDWDQLVDVPENLAYIGTAGDQVQANAPRVLTSADDLNDITAPGRYAYAEGNVPANTPFPGGGALVVYTIPGNLADTIQEVQGSGIGFFRTMNPMGDWNAWQQGAVLGENAAQVRPNAQNDARFRPRFDGVLLVGSIQYISSPNFVDRIWTLARYDTLGFWDSGTPQLVTIPPGVRWVRLAARITLSAPSDNKPQFRLYKNGLYLDSSGGFQGQYYTVAPQSADIPRTSAVLEVEAGDYFSIRVSAGSDWQASVGAPSWFHLEVVG